MRALVAGGLDFGESDRVVHLLTEHGAVSAFAHGAKKSRRRFAGALEPFTTIDVELSEGRRKKGGLPTLTRAEVEQPRLRIRSELERIALAAYFVELARATAPEGDDATEAYRLTTAALDHLDAGPATLAAQRAFELRLLALLGYHPDLHRCVACGADPGRTWLDLERGGLLCREHREGAPEIGPKTLQWARAVLEGGPSFEPDAGRPREWADTAARKLTGPTAAMWRQILDRPLKALGLLESIRL